MKYTKAEKAEAEATIKDLVQEGAEIYTRVQAVASSGMSRKISAYVVATDDNGRPYIASLDWYIAVPLELMRPMYQDGLRIHGAGMDMGYWLASNVARVAGIKEWHHRTI